MRPKHHRFSLLFGNAGDAGDDTLDGGNGTDTAWYSGSSTDYLIGRNFDGTIFVIFGAPHSLDILTTGMCQLNCLLEPHPPVIDPV